MKTGTAEFQSVTSVAFLPNQEHLGYLDFLEAALNETESLYSDEDYNPYMTISDPSMLHNGTVYEEEIPGRGFGFQIHSGDKRKN